MNIKSTLLGLAAAACAQPLAPNDAAVSLAAAESAFAAHSMREDMRAAFLANFADDGVFVRNGWMVSNDFLRGRAPPPILLDWRPAFTEVAASGDLGLSTGPTRLVRKATPDAPPAYGQYVSIWRRQGEGPWKVIADLGIGHAQPALWTQALDARMAPEPRATAVSTLADAEERFSGISSRDGLRAAYGAHGAAGLRFYRNDAGPAMGRGAALASPSMGEERIAWTIERLETARSGEFGYSRGRYAAAAAPGKVLGWYLRAWHIEGGAWRILMDVANPAPAP
jgi:ketosteroid isomerase-like protein